MDALQYQQLDFANQHDVAEVARTHCATPGEWVAGHSYTEQTLHSTLSELEAATGRNWVMLARNAAGDIAGIHWAQFAGEHGEIRSLWVHPNFRRQGVATKMKALAECWLREQGAKEVKTKVFAANQPMIAFNKKLGYDIASVSMVKKLK